MSMRTLIALLALSLSAAAHAVESPSWEGWIVGEPCADRLQVADCPLRHIERPVLLLEDGRALAFVMAEGRVASPAEVDKAYGKKVRIQGGLQDGVLQPVKLEVLEVSGERKFFKGCL
jgi:hypothetical protein